MLQTFGNANCYGGLLIKKKGDHSVSAVGDSLSLASPGSQCWRYGEETLWDSCSGGTIRLPSKLWSFVGGHGIIWSSIQVLCGFHKVYLLYCGSYWRSAVYFDIGCRVFFVQSCLHANVLSCFPFLALSCVSLLFNAWQSCSVGANNSWPSDKHLSVSLLRVKWPEKLTCK